MERIVQIIAPTSQCAQLSHFACSLEKLGYKPQIVSIPADKHTKINHQHGQLLFLSDSDSLTELKAQLNDWQTTPQLVAFAQGMSWDRDILNICSEVMTWPCPNSELLFRLEHAFSRLENSSDDMLSEVLIRLNMIGQAPSFLQALSLIRRIAKYEATVLISGETGTGKELAARAIHYLSETSDGPFVPVNCGGIPDELFENELFGHTRGAYTDAKGKQCGYVEQANGGTLFLDEIDALSLKSQTTLLRLLQDQFYKPLGSEKLRHANIRIVAATNANLLAMVNAQQFRQDLLFRLDVLSIELPALRHRAGDAARLAEYFITKFSREYGKAPRPLHPLFLSWIQDHSWPGNIRELENTILRAFLLSDGKFVSHSDEHEEESVGTMSLGRFNEQKARAIAGFERQYLERLLIQAEGNISLAAKLAGKERRALGKLLQKHGINRVDFVQSSR
jgi:DNA-binding NtrC family response regulator